MTTDVYPNTISNNTASSTAISFGGIFLMILICALFACLCAGCAHFCCRKRDAAAIAAQQKKLVAMPAPQALQQIQMQPPSAPAQPYPYAYPYMQFVPQYYAYPNGYPQYIQPYAPVPQQEQ